MGSGCVDPSFDGTYIYDRPLLFWKQVTIYVSGLSIDLSTVSELSIPRLKEMFQLHRFMHFSSPFDLAVLPHNNICPSFSFLGITKFTFFFPLA